MGKHRGRKDRHTLRERGEGKPETGGWWRLGKTTAVDGDDETSAGPDHPPLRHDPLAHFIECKKPGSVGNINCRRQVQRCDVRAVARHSKTIPLSSSTSWTFFTWLTAGIRVSAIYCLSCPDCADMGPLSFSASAAKDSAVDVSDALSVDIVSKIRPQGVHGLTHPGRARLM